MQDLLSADQQELINSLKRLGHSDALDGSPTLVDVNVESPEGRRDVAYLHQHLSRGTAEERAVARGALSYITSEGRRAGPIRRHLGLSHLEYVAALAANHLRRGHGEDAIAPALQLLAADKRRAERMFKELLRGPKRSDALLISEARSFCRRPDVESGPPFMTRLLRNTEFLISTIERRDLSKQFRDYARAALSYLVTEQDVIPDSLGLVGLLDDGFILDMAVSMIDPCRKTWTDLLEAVDTCWPLIGHLDVTSVAGNIDAEVVLSFAALRSEPHRGHGTSQHSALSVPLTGPATVLLAWAAAVRRLGYSADAACSILSAAPGQTVCVGGRATARWDGYTCENGLRCVRLSWFDDEESPATSSVVLPVTELPQVAFADPGRRPAGPVFAAGETSAEGLGSWLQKSARSAVCPAVVVVMEPETAQRIAGATLFDNIPLTELLPWAVGNADGTLHWWGPPTQHGHPLIVVVRDVEGATGFTRCHPGATPILVAPPTLAPTERVSLIPQPAGTKASLATSLSDAPAKAPGLSSFELLQLCKRMQDTKRRLCDAFARVASGEVLDVLRATGLLGPADGSASIDVAVDGEADDRRSLDIRRKRGLAREIELLHSEKSALEARGPEAVKDHRLEIIVRKMASRIRRLLDSHADFQKVIEKTRAATVSRASGAAQMTSVAPAFAGVSRLQQDFQVMTRLRQTLAQGNLSLVHWVLKRMNADPVLYPDLFQEGTLGLMRGIEKYDHQMGTRFATYVTWWIRHWSERYIANHGSLVRVPVHKQDTMKKLRKAEWVWRQRTGTTPTVEQLSDATGIGVRTVRECLILVRNHDLGVLALDAPADSESGRSRGDLLADMATSSAAEAVEAIELQEGIRNALQGLKPKEAEVLRLRFGVGVPEAMTLEMIGERMNVTRERIRQVEAVALAKLQKRARHGALLKGHLD
ncbi:MAG: sigma-70 family RNA polymerase sigma factor [Myxococcota bacterium]